MFEFVLFSDVLFEIDQHLDQLGLGNVAEGRCIDRLMPLAFQFRIFSIRDTVFDSIAS